MVPTKHLKLQYNIPITSENANPSESSEDRNILQISKSVISNTIRRNPIHNTGRFYKTSQKHLARQMANTANDHIKTDKVCTLSETPLKYYQQSIPLGSLTPHSPYYSDIFYNNGK